MLKNTCICTQESKPLGAKFMREKILQIGLLQIFMEKKYTDRGFPLAVPIFGSYETSHLLCLGHASVQLFFSQSRIAAAREFGYGRQRAHCP